MFQVQFPSGGMDKEVGGQTAVANEGPCWNPYHVDVPYLLYNQWTGLDWSQLPNIDYQNNSQPYGAVDTLSQHSPVFNDSGFASRIDPSHPTPEQVDHGLHSPSYTTELQSLGRDNASSLPSQQVSPTSFGESEYNEPDYSEHDDQAREPLKKRHRTRQSPPSEQVPTTASRRQSTVQEEPSPSDYEYTSPGRRGSQGNGRPANKLERNRLAANRCRIRKRAETEALKADKIKMEKQHMKLASEVDELTDEVYQLKRELFLHADCDCTLIQECIKNGFRCDGGKPLPRRR